MNSESVGLFVQFLESLLTDRPQMDRLYDSYSRCSATMFRPGAGQTVTLGGVIDSFFTSENSVDDGFDIYFNTESLHWMIDKIVAPVIVSDHIMKTMPVLCPTIWLKSTAPV
jgi:hypothetical protein